jgi:FG-GAP repeat
MNRPTIASLFFVSLAAMSAQPRCDAQVQSAVKISDGSMGIPPGTLAANGWFGHGVADLGNLGPTAPTSRALAIGAWNDSGHGAVWISFVDQPPQSPTDPPSGTVHSLVKITENTNGFLFPLSPDGRFGHSVTRLGDLDNDGAIEIAIGQPRNNAGSSNRGAVWIVSLNPDGKVKQSGMPAAPQVVKITDASGGFPAGLLDDGDNFGISVGTLPDLDGNGVPELAVGAHGDDDGISDPPGHTGAGAVYILFLQSDGSVHHFTKLSDNGAPTSPLPLGDNDRFGESVQYLGNVGSQHVLAVGAIGDNSEGAVWMIPLSNAGTIASTPTKIANGLGGLPAGTLDTLDKFGHSLAALGDMDDDGGPEIAVGSNNDDTGGIDAGSVYVCFMKSDLSVKSFYEITEGASEFPGLLDDHEHFSMVASIADFDGNGIKDLAVGAAHGDLVGSPETGSVWLLKLNQYGHGCPGSCGIAPRLTTTTTAAPSSPIRVAVTDAMGGLGFAGLFVGLQQTSLPMGAGCRLYVQPLLPMLVLPLGGNGCGNGQSVLATTIPPGLGGFTFLLQAFSVDAGAILGFTGTNAVAIHFDP